MALVWVFTSEKIIACTIDERRSHHVVVEILGRKFRGVLVGERLLYGLRRQGF